MCMTIVHSGAEYQVYTNQIETYSALPVGQYYVEFSKNKGFFLVEAPSIKIGEDKIYGHRGRKAKKIFDAFQRADRSIGVILSGDKGIGKSLFARLLCRHAIDAVGMPVVIVQHYIPGIAEFIETIDQECLVMFDEFDKTIGGRGEEANARQTEFIQLFDGIVQGKRLYVITCNETWSLSEFFLNRPGRFHYHIRFKNPDESEIREYLQDKLPEECWGEIDKVCEFSALVPLNYDMLRAIAFELEDGSDFEDAIQDMNITQPSTQQSFFATLILKNGERSTERRVAIDMGNSADDFETVTFCFGQKEVCVMFSVWNMVIRNGVYRVDGSHIEVPTTGRRRSMDGDVLDLSPDEIDRLELRLDLRDSNRHDTAAFRFN